MSWGLPHPLSPGTTGEIEQAHAALDAVGVIGGPLAVRITTYLAARRRSDGPGSWVNHGRPCPLCLWNEPHAHSHRDDGSIGPLVTPLDGVEWVQFNPIDHKGFQAPWTYTRV